MSINAIETEDLTKRFGSVTAVNGLSLSVAKGEIFGLLGPNAAGKSTTIRLLAGIMALDGGSAQILGLDLASETESIKRRIGYVAQQFGLYPELTVLENLAFYSAAYDVHDPSRLRGLLADYGLAHMANQAAGTLSGGYKRRLAIICALSHDPELIFLDEPTAGIDPVTRKDIWQMFYELSNQGKTLFVTTHYMEEAERCAQLAFIHHGRLAAKGSPENIKDSLNNVAVYSCHLRYNPELINALEHTDGILVLNQMGGELRIVADRGLPREQIESILGGDGNKVELRNSAARIEDAFMFLIREENRT